MSVNKKIIETEAIPPLGDFEFNTVIWSGNGSGTTQSITGVGFKPDFVWYKVRNYVYWNEVVDSSRGAGIELYTNSQNGESTGNRLTSFNSDGFSVTGSANDSGRNYVAWCLKANGGTTSSNTNGTITSTVQAVNGFSIVEYTGTGSSGSVGHGLSSAPELVITKARTTISPSISEAWVTYFSNVDKLGYLDQTYAFGAATSVYTNPEVSSTTFNLDNWRGINQNGVNYMAYCFHSVSGYSKIGTYTATGGNQTITLGFQPGFLMIKATSRVSAWLVMDTARNTTSPFVNFLVAQDSGAEFYAPALSFSYSSTGFSITNTDGTFNDAGETYIYVAFKSGP
jgi:hypothetical protein